MSDYDSGNGESVAYIMALIILLGMVGPSIPSPPPDSIVNPFSCKSIEGSVIDKKHDDEGYRLYVELFIESEWEGHIIWVSNRTYNDYEIGYTYEETICDIVEYEDILSIYDNAIDLGWLTPTSIPTIPSPS